MKKYIKTRQLGNRGEAFFEALITHYALVHKITGSKDIGLDFLCEWICGSQPTQLLFGVQIKTRSADTLKSIKSYGKSRLNWLEQFKINGVPVDKDTLDYWRGFDFPIFLFLIIENGNELNCFYKRYTPILQGLSKQSEEYFYKVNDKQKFLAFAEENKKIKGFCRDLFIDYVRCNYNKGILIIMDPMNLGLREFKRDAIFIDLIEDYKKRVFNTYKIYTNLFNYFKNKSKNE